MEVQAAEAASAVAEAIAEAVRAEAWEAVVAEVIQEEEDNIKSMIMRRILFTTALMFMAMAAGAQTIYDGLMYSERNYEGTARSIAMGNAFTALGGDLGGVGINPAGSAVAKYTQVVLTPTLSIASTATPGYRYTSATTAIPNYGIMFNWDTSRASGLKNITFGFVVNQVNDFNADVYAAGRNTRTSFMGAMAEEATQMGLSGAELAADNAYAYNPYKYVVGYQSCMISNYINPDAKPEDITDNVFVGASELPINGDEATSFALGGPIEQTYGRQVVGKKSDLLLNLGLNVSDCLYLGANLGVTTMYYNYSDYFKETAEDYTDFEHELGSGETTYFKNMKYANTFNAETSGVYGKFGFIFTPGYGLRIGGAVQTPTVTTVYEEWYMDGETEFSDTKYNAAAGSPLDYDSYTLIEPWRANFGIAYVYKKLAALSVDYEFCDYSTLKFKDEYNGGRDYFKDMNSLIRSTFRTSHMLRAGIEVKPLSRLAIRAGYGLTTAPDKEEFSPALTTEEASKGLGWIAKRSTAAVQNIAFGLGYSSNDSFFADIACRYNFQTSEYFMPYDAYIPGVEVPEYTITKDSWKVLLTLGWRF